MACILKLAGLTLLTLGLAQSGLASESLCSSDEFVYFSCRAASKTISLCGSKELGENLGYLQYKYGTPKKADLTFPTQKIAPIGVFVKDFQLWSHGGYESSISFTVGEYLYSVYSALQLGSTESMNEDRTGAYGPRAGVRVYRRDHLVRDIRCRDEDVMQNDPRDIDASLPASLKPKE
ncbi:hypothetical protein [Polaromonas hydrogenivorans]|uniref:Uncharacterized protein n=1 Tax=Polaromonas hydrogenivorans TaxID=335476 RepID=A0AAU7LRS9_9BURK